MTATMTEVETKLAVICSRKELLAALKAVSGIIRTRTPRPILACVKLSGSENAVTLHTTNLEQSIVYTCRLVQLESAGEVCVSVMGLLEIVGDGTSDTLNLSVDGDRLLVKDDSGKFRLATMSARDFPPHPATDDEPIGTVPAKEFIDALERVGVARAKVDGRYPFSGILLDCMGKSINLVATEGHMLALMPIAYVGKKFNPTIVPGSAVDSVVGLVCDEAEVGIWINDNSIRFSGDDWVLFSNLLEGTPVPYMDSIPKEFDHALKSGLQDLVDAIRRGGMAVSDSHKGVACDLSANGCRYTSRNGDGADAEEFRACKFEGQPITIGVNPKFLLAGLSSCRGETVEWSMNAPNRPTRLKDGEFIFICMPVNLQ